MATPQVQLRSLYRRILRELPSRTGSQTVLSHPSTLQQQVRASIVAQPANMPKSPLSRASLADSESASSLFNKDSGIHAKTISEQIAEGEQFVKYVQSQRQYLSLLERYNPGMNMTEEERTRLTARRVGMDLPVDEFGKVL